MKRQCKVSLIFAFITLFAFVSYGVNKDFTFSAIDKRGDGKDDIKAEEQIVNCADSKDVKMKNSHGAKSLSGGPSYSILAALPKSVFQAASEQGSLETFHYDIVKDGVKIKKHAHVYLPFGYDKEDKSIRYNVIYLMHGGGDDASSFFSDKRGPLPLTRVLDHLIEEGKMPPVIVVTPTFYDLPAERGGMQEAVRQTRDFHLELKNFLIPSLESHYKTHLSGKDKNSIKRSRAHRAYGGFSMGALSAWYQLAFGLDAVKYFIPLSGDLWVYDAQNRKIGMDETARWLNGKISESEFANDFKVLAYTGTKDIAYEPQKSLIASLFKLAPLFNEENLTFKLKENGVHYYGDVNEYLYDALPLIWDNK